MKLLTGIKQFLNKPKPRCIYAVTEGQYLGEFLVYIEVDDTGAYCFLSLPDMHVRKFIKSDVCDWVETGILDKVERLPNDVFSLCYEQYLSSCKNRERGDIVPIKHEASD